MRRKGDDEFALRGCSCGCGEVKDGWQHVSHEAKRDARRVVCYVIILF